MISKPNTESMGILYAVQSILMLQIPHLRGTYSDRVRGRTVQFEVGELQVRNLSYLRLQFHGLDRSDIGSSLVQS